MNLDFQIATRQREELVDISAEVNGLIGRAGVREGVCFVYIPHTTAGVTINEGADPDVAADMIRILRTIVPRDPGYAHAEGNSDAHLKATMTGICQTVPVRNGRLALGRWQALYFCEFDGPRTRRVIIHVIPD